MRLQACAAYAIEAEHLPEWIATALDTNTDIQVSELVHEP